MPGVYKKTKGWVNAYYLLRQTACAWTSASLNQEDDGAGATMRGR